MGAPDQQIQFAIGVRQRLRRLALDRLSGRAQV
jgi:hypothetical protein